MKFAVISDSHGNIDYIDKVVEKIKASGVHLVLHLGDNYEDANRLIALGMDLLRVPGVFSPFYQDPAVPNRILTELGGKKILLTHSALPHENDMSDDIPPAEMAVREKADLVLYGHTHIPAIEDRDGILWVNPGHLKNEDKKGYPASYAIIETGKAGAKIDIIALADGTVILHH